MATTTLQRFLLCPEAFLWLPGATGTFSHTAAHPTYKPKRVIPVFTVFFIVKKLLLSILSNLKKNHHQNNTSNQGGHQVTFQDVMDQPPSGLDLMLIMNPTEPSVHRLGSV